MPCSPSGLSITVAIPSGPIALEFLAFLIIRDTVSHNNPFGEELTLLMPYGPVGIKEFKKKKIKTVKKNAIRSKTLPYPSDSS